MPADRAMVRVERRKTTGGAMSPADADVFPVHWLSPAPVEHRGLDLGSARVEDLFDAWVFAARDAEVALVAWSLATGAERGETFAVYRAALEREERAAVVLGAAAAAGRCPAR
jgi:hypothetical protein